MEISGLPSSGSVLDGSTGANRVSGTSANPGTLATANANDILIGVVQAQGGATVGSTKPTGFTQVFNQLTSESNGCAVAYEVVSSTGTYGGTWTMASPYSVWGVLLFALTAASSGGALVSQALFLIGD
jgi:hypothetical protein